MRTAADVLTGPRPADVATVVNLAIRSTTTSRRLEARVVRPPPSRGLITSRPADSRVIYAAQIPSRTPEESAACFVRAVQVGCFTPSDVDPTGASFSASSSCDTTSETWHLSFTLPMVHPSALRCLARLMCDFPRPDAILSFEGAELDAAPEELCPVQAVSDDMPVTPSFAVNDSPAGLTPVWPRHFGRKHMRMAIVGRSGTEAALRGPLEAVLMGWASLANKGFPDPFHGWSWAPIPEVHCLFPDELTVSVDDLTCGSLGVQALVSALDHLSARVAPITRFTYT